MQMNKIVYYATMPLWGILAPIVDVFLTPIQYMRGRNPDPPCMTFFIDEGHRLHAQSQAVLTSHPGEQPYSPEHNL